MKLDWLVVLLDEIAATTWGLLKLSRTLGNHTSETTVTETNVLRLRAASVIRGLPVQVHQFTQIRERQTGADLELWVETDGGAALGFSIQAKRLYSGTKTKNYNKLRERDDKSGKYQYETLMDHADSVGSIPIHVFYNGGDIEEVPSLVAGWRRPHDVYGCAAMRTSDVVAIRKAAGKNGSHRGTSAALFVASQFPWSDLFRLPPATQAVGEPASTDMSDLAAVARSIGHGDNVLAPTLPPYLASPDVDPAQYGSLPSFAIVVRESDLPESGDADSEDDLASESS